jgi:hypothetical protein
VYPAHLQKWKKEMCGVCPDATGPPVIYITGNIQAIILYSFEKSIETELEITILSL